VGKAVAESLSAVSHRLNHPNLNNETPKNINKYKYLIRNKLKTSVQIKYFRRAVINISELRSEYLAVASATKQ